MDDGGGTTEWTMSRINIYILDRYHLVGAIWHARTLAIIIINRVLECTGEVMISSPPWKLSGELCSARTTCLVTSYLLCVPTVLSAACLMTITSTFSRYLKLSIISDDVATQR